ncbi:MAG TPA: hypothetical protein VGZ72_01885, partial [Stellaceae bacterium]|nr:hypothetical protein [Stellaceae bacterium]
MAHDFNRLGESTAAGGIGDRGHPRFEDGLEGGAGGLGIERREATPRETEPRSLAPLPSGAPQSGSPVSASGAPKRRNLRAIILVVVLVAAAVLGGWYGYRWWTVGRFIVWTDDAYVGAKTATL